MKPISPLLFAMFALSVIAVNAQNARNNGYVNVTVGDENATSELLRMPLGSEGTSADFDIGIMYFGPSSDSDLSTILYMNGSRARYSSESAYGVKLITDDIALGQIICAVSCEWSRRRALTDFISTLSEKSLRGWRPVREFELKSMTLRMRSFLIQSPSLDQMLRSSSDLRKVSYS